MFGPDLLPQLVGNNGLRTLEAAIAEPERFAIEPKVDGVRGLVCYLPDRTIEARNRGGQKREWFRHEPIRRGVRALAERLPLLCDGTVLDDELTAGRFEGTLDTEATHSSMRPGVQRVRNLATAVALALVVVLVVAACSPSSTASSAAPASGTARVAATSQPVPAVVTPTPASSAPAVQPTAAATTRPSPTPRATPRSPSLASDPYLGRAVVTVIAGLRIRSQPRVSDDSIKHEPLLPLGTDLFVLEGPVSASGYTWYRVVPLSFSQLELSRGWIAAASRDGEPWIAPAGIECPPVPSHVSELRDVPRDLRLACFSGQPITVQARVIECNCDVDGGYYDPAWFGWGGQPLLLVEPSETAAPDDTESWLVLMLDPAGRHPDPLPVGQIVNVTGMFDHPDARGCLFQNLPIESGPPEPTDACRYMFATTSLVAVGP